MPPPNLTRTPERRGQQPNQRRRATVADIEALQVAIDNKANASTVGGVVTSLKATKAEVEELAEKLDD